jgi:glucose-6-phosphate isomerase
MLSEIQYAKKFTSGNVFVDPKTGFTLNYAGIIGFDLKKSIIQNSNLIEEAFQEIKRIENGEIVNKTAVVAESENRAVDHYSLRDPKKGLDDTKDYNAKVVKKINEIKNEYQAIGIGGIGGSILGPRMVLISQLSEHYNRKLETPLFMMANTDADDFHNLMQLFGPRHLLMSHISKSGGTAETKGNMEAFIDILKKEKMEIGRYNLAVTTPGSPFDLFAQENNFRAIFHMSENTGGRTSLGSAVGMVPMAFAGLDFNQFIDGMSYMDELTRRQDPEQNPAMIFALAFKHILERDGLWGNPDFQKNMIALFYKSNQMEVAHYFQQLIMESLGKNYKKDGTPIRTGLTTFGGTGTGEQHAFMQQIQKGIRDAFVIIFKYRRRSADYYNQKAGSMGQQLNSFAEGTSKALRGNGVDIFDVIQEQNDLPNLSMTVAFVERVVTIIGSFLSINPYDQPGVQDGKKAADEINEFKKKLTVLFGAVTGHVSATAEEFNHYLSRSELYKELIKNEAEAYEKIPAMEDFLSDLEANINVPNAYPALKDKIRVSRVYDIVKKQWIYSVENRNK